MGSRAERNLWGFFKPVVFNPDCTSEISGELFRQARPYLRSIKSEYQGVGSPAPVFNSPLGDSNVQPGLRTTVLQSIIPLALISVCLRMKSSGENFNIKITHLGIRRLGL